MSMNAYNPIESLAMALGAAVHQQHVLPDIEYLYKTPTEHREGKEGTMKKRRPDLHRDLEVVHFPQTWGSTALGFGGMGGAAMSTAYTTVVIMNHLYAAVFFAGEYAYTVKMDEVFDRDLRDRRISDISGSKKYDRLNLK